jgi:hypothetical protein
VSACEGQCPVVWSEECNGGFLSVTQLTPFLPTHKMALVAVTNVDVLNNVSEHPTPSLLGHMA